MHTSSLPRASVLACIAALLPLGASATTPTPASGSIGPADDDFVEWSSDQPYPSPSTASATCSGPTNPSCDNFTLNITPPVGNSTVTVALQPLGGDDWDLEVYSPAGVLLGSSGNSPGALEVVSISLTGADAGAYTVSASPFAAVAGYDAVASIVSQDPPPPPGAEDIEFYIYVDPGNHQGGEPSGGVNWNDEATDGAIGGDNGGSIMFVSSLTTLRVEHDDCTAPAGYLPDGEWKDISVPNHLLSLDPIGLVDPITGRYFSDQLAVKSSLLGLSDDNGDSWTLSTTGAPLNPGVDHQTLGTGPFAEPLYSALKGNSVDAHANEGHGVYYASQDIALAQAGFSVDGGLTFGPANPMWTLGDCSGLHGHLKVSPRTNDNTDYRGWIYVPNKSCNGQQGVAISEDNGLTWRISRVPGTTAGEWDPSVGIGNDGTVYIGMDQGGAPQAAVSLDGGDTWSDPIDVSGGLIKTTSFSTMVAGDGDRAAFGFLGTTTPGSLGVDPSGTFPAVWDLYVAMTFDRGLTWNITNVTNGDPVQRGVICDQGTTCPSNRNLLDFNDIQMDKRGRPIVYFADGCTGNCVNNDSQRTQARLATTARLKSPKGLLSAFDAERTGVPDWPAASAVNQGLSDVLISWQEPGDGGNDIDFYEIRKNGTVLDTLPPTFSSYTDPGAQSDPAGTYWEVLAHNALGYSRGPNGTPHPLKASCDNRLFPGGGPIGPHTTKCDFEGETILEDPSGDLLVAGNPAAGTPGAASYDLLRLGISQNEDIYGPENIAFIVEVQSTDVLVGNAYWPLQFKLPGAADAWVRMDTVVGTPLAPRFTFGFGTGIDPVLNPGLPLEPQSEAADGRIVMIVNKADLGVANADDITQFLIRVRLNFGAATLTPDNMPDSLSGEGSYTVVDYPTHCEINLPPIADPDTATTDACHPVVIDVLANDSDPENDPITVTGVSGATNGIAVVIDTVDGQMVEYRPNFGFTGSETLTYTITDGINPPVEGTIDVTINATPDGDGDGVMNSCDNCLLIPNPDQCNTNDGPNGDVFGNICDADTTNNGIVNSFDLQDMREAFGSSGVTDTDLNCNGITNTFDLQKMREQFGGAPGPSGLPQ